MDEKLFKVGLEKRKKSSWKRICRKRHVFYDGLK